MRKLLPILAALLALPGLAAAEPGPITGEVTVAFGWVKKADGTKVNIAGKKFPYRAYPISTRKLDPTHPNVIKRQRSSQSRSSFKDFLEGNKNVGFGAYAPDSADQIVYQADAGTGYGYVEDNPSSLDDINLTSAAAGKPWRTLAFGMQYHNSSFSPFIIRWRCYGTNTDNPPGQTDFADEFADFGVRWDVNLAAGGFFTEIDISQAAVSTSDSSIYIAQQFRDPHPTGPFGIEDGEGAFKLGQVDTIFNAFAPPTTGTSADQFWYDWDPAPDGLYENTEIDIFEGNVANHLLTLKVAASGSTSSLTPIDVRMGIGRNPSGNLQSIVSNDGNTFNVNPSHTVSRNSPVGSIEADFWQLATGVNGIRISGKAGVNISGCNQSIDIYNFANNSWVHLNTASIPNGFNTFNEAYGGTIPIGNFIGSVNHPFFGNVNVIRARVRFINTTDLVPRNWEMKLDQLQCTVTTN